jgi:hypothetical protein
MMPPYPEKALFASRHFYVRAVRLQGSNRKARQGACLGWRFYEAGPVADNLQIHDSANSNQHIRP